MPKEPAIPDFQIIDEKTFHEVFDLLHDRLCFFAYELMGDQTGVEDIVQEAFVKLWQKRSDFDNLRSVKSFLYVVVKNQCFNILKHEKLVKRKGAVLSAERWDEIEQEAVIESEVLENLFRAIKALPEGCRSVLQLGYFRKMKNQEIAEYLEISINTVKTQKKRALQLLRGFLKYPAFWWFSFLLE